MKSLRLSLLLLLVLTSGCSSRSTTLSSSPPSVSLPVVSVTRKTLANTIIVQGTAVALPDHSVKISPVISGKIAQVYVTVGERVSRGQVVAELDSRQMASQLSQQEAAVAAANADLATARANLDLAVKNLERVKLLFQDKIGAQKDVITAKNQFQTAKASLTAAQARQRQAAAAREQAATGLDLTKLRTPISGVVGVRFLNVGDSADPATPVLQVVDLSTMQINANIPADSPVAVAKGNPVEATTSAYPGEVFSGTVVSVSPIIDPQSNTFTAQIRLPNKNLRLKEGLAMTASITTAVNRDVLAVPKMALVPNPDDPKGNMVYVVGSNKIQRVPVVTGVESNGNVEIKSGLRFGAMIVASGGYGLSDGTLITPIPVRHP